jgi:hypothetical protein
VARLELLADAVIAVEAVRDDSGVARMISDGSRWFRYKPLLCVSYSCTV